MRDVKVLFHVSDCSVWQKAINNIINFLKDVEEGSAQIEVVANAGAVTAYYDEDKQQLVEQMKLLTQRGVLFTACRNALKAHELDVELLPEFIEPVSGGITELVRKQAEGYFYIKP